MIAVQPEPNEPRYPRIVSYPGPLRSKHWWIIGRTSTGDYPIFGPYENLSAAIWRLDRYRREHA